MATNWKKKNNGLRWGTGCGFFYFIYYAFLQGNIFNGRNELWEDISLSVLCIALPIVVVFLFYWPQQKAAAKAREKEDT